MTRTKALHHIHRKDDDARRTHAWFVLIQRENLNLRQSFSDAQWGGKRKALAAAKAWRDEHMDSQAQYVFEMAQRTIVRRNNRSGTAGVGRYERKARDGRRASAFWLATWVDETGVHRTKKFSVGRWGESMAEQMALEVREREMRNAVAKRTGVDGG